MTCLTYADLPEEKVKKVAGLEKDIDVILLAYEKPPAAADLSSENLRRVKQLEEELGVRLVAYA
ncbi:hypothetical protein FGU65_14645 [Methanoculleus sp. FWC-SCC1]|uniref:GTPase HflX n=1 Tax=Methanoculleus frigidifontis TaxID=2584085 RepID=A0ABT8MDU0_9EURY|nr:hypothetical protein [Methanoculleus sp. FWC-SCC1]MDN7026103.1 hypothetical protein [Methanoculleus sp. FWC-SCC1]